MSLCEFVAKRLIETASEENTVIFSKRYAIRIIYIFRLDLPVRLITARHRKTPTRHPQDTHKTPTRHPQDTARQRKTPTRHPQDTARDLKYKVIIYIQGLRVITTVHCWGMVGLKTSQTFFWKVFSPF